MREKPDTATTARTVVVACKHGELERQDSATENRGVSGSSPGLATSRGRNPAWKLDSLLVGGMAGELVSPAHETVVMSPHRVAGRGTSRKACNTATLDPRSASVVVVGNGPWAFPAVSAFIPTRRRPIAAGPRGQRRARTPSWRPRWPARPRPSRPGSHLGCRRARSTITEPARHSKPSWYLIASDDRMIPPPAQHTMSARISATVVEAAGSHSICLTAAGDRRH